MKAHGRRHEVVPCEDSQGAFYVEIANATLRCVTSRRVADEGAVPWPQLQRPTANAVAVGNEVQADEALKASKRRMPERR